MGSLRERLRQYRDDPEVRDVLGIMSSLRGELRQCRDDPEVRDVFKQTGITMGLTLVSTAGAVGGAFLGAKTAERYFESPMAAGALIFLTGMLGFAVPPAALWAYYRYQNR